VSFAAITLYVASQRVFIIVVYFAIDSVRKLLDVPSPEDVDWILNAKDNVQCWSLANTVVKLRLRKMLRISLTSESI
jgi:hypothetical protein